jgi:hypothetical protein
MSFYRCFSRMKREKSDELANKSTTGMLKSSSMDEPGTSRIPQPTKTGIPVLRQSGASLIPSPIGPTAIAMGSPSVQQKVFKPLPAKAEVTVETSIVRETVRFLYMVYPKKANLFKNRQKFKKLKIRSSFATSSSAVS